MAKKENPAKQPGKTRSKFQEAFIYTLLCCTELDSGDIQNLTHAEVNKETGQLESNSIKKEIKNEALRIFMMLYLSIHSGNPTDPLFSFDGKALTAEEIAQIVHKCKEAKTASLNKEEKK